MLAHHYASALEFARASGQPVDAIADRARVALFEAGERAYGLFAYASAAGFYRDAVELWPSGEPGGGRLLFRYARSVDLSDSAVDALPLLEEARDLLLAEDEREVAAEAEIALGQYHWFRADRASATPREEQAAVLIEGVEPSRAKAFVLSELSRFAMLRDEDARAVDLAERALAMAEEFGADEVRARALNILGVSTVKLGDRRGLADVERSIEITAEIGSPEVLRGYINLASTLAELGELERSSELHAKGLKEAERIGAPEPLRWLRAERIWDDYSGAGGTKRRARRMRSCRMQGRVIRDTWRLLRCSFAPSYGLREATARRRWKTRTPSWVLPGRRRIPRYSFRPSRFTVTYSSPPIPERTRARFSTS